MMQIVTIIGALMTLAGLVGLGWCVRKALWLKRAEMAPEEARSAVNQLMVGHMAAIGGAFMGLGLVLTGLLLG